MYSCKEEDEDRNICFMYVVSGVPSVCRCSVSAMGYYYYFTIISALNLNWLAVPSHTTAAVI